MATVTTPLGASQQKIWIRLDLFAWEGIRRHKDIVPGLKEHGRTPFNLVEIVGDA